ncbi:hypothetical protein CH373_04445 [Leptospira perolatii]|uniref:Lipoprotein n=1 Tax=Leptospira perolatii TaxID=2023191 RepID=A0A2M9ZQ23_9LEPT|nr:hypothetical protein [Leptospira perolatii]PJZ68247.1 hypothetical protein CH360_17170 [Leptospira perolatii]PJZ74172.1 hypothetical protein CH373_04445 [Leptospira perolatii]
MKKYILLLLAVAALAATNCTYKYKDVPQVGTSVLRLAEADYTVGAETSGKACGFYLFHLVNLPSLFGSNEGDVGGSAFTRTIEAQANYDALSKLEGATYIVHPKYESESTAYFIFGNSTCVTVKARAITLKNGPVSSK